MHVVKGAMGSEQCPYFISFRSIHFDVLSIVLPSLSFVLMHDVIHEMLGDSHIATFSYQRQRDRFQVLLHVYMIQSEKKSLDGQPTIC